MVHTGEQTLLQLTAAEPKPYFNQLKTTVPTNKPNMEYKIVGIHFHNRCHNGIFLL